MDINNWSAIIIDISKLLTRDQVQDQKDDNRPTWDIYNLHLTKMLLLFCENENSLKIK